MYFLYGLFLLLISSFNSAHCSKYAALVVDEKGRVLHEENAQARRIPASLTKKMTLYVIFNALKSGRISLKTRFQACKLAARQEPSKIGLRDGESISIEAAIKAMVTISANDAAYTIAKGLSGSIAAFVAEMNQMAKKLGMHHTHFKNVTGLPVRDGTGIENTTTAMDMIKLAMALHVEFPEYYHYFKTMYFEYGGRSRRSHNHMLGNYEGVDGLKTGFINASGFNISTSALRYDQNDKPRRLFIVLMGGTTWRNRDKRAGQLLDMCFKKLDNSSARFLSLPVPGSKQVKRTASQNALHQHLAETTPVDAPQQEVAAAASVDTVATNNKSSQPLLLIPVRSVTPVNVSTKHAQQMTTYLKTQITTPTKAVVQPQTPVKTEIPAVTAYTAKPTLPTNWVVGTLESQASLSSKKRKQR